MIAFQAYTRCSLRFLAGMVTALSLAVFPANAQNKDKKPSAPAPKTSAPAKSTPAAKPGGGNAAAHGPTTAGASHGPTTSNPHVTTANAGHTTTTTTAGHTTTANTGRTTTTTGAHPNTAVGAAGTRGPGGSPSNRIAAGGHPANAARPMGNHVVPANSRITRTPTGSEVRTRPNGRVADVHDARRGMDIHHGLNGSRRVEVERADHTRIVAERGHGYVEHPYHYGGREFGHRTYYYHGRVYDRYYGHYYYHGAYVAYYAPAFYYRPAFYGWVYNPWVAPVTFAWGWAGNPWYGYYGFYFTPYPVYASASLWLTDYMLSATLAAAYQAQVDANAAAQAQAAADAAALTEATKNLIAAEVQRQIALENAESQSAQAAAPDPASSSIQRLLTDGVQHVFVAGAALDVVNAQGAECAVSQGDALQLTGPPAPDATSAELVMLSSKGGIECQQGVTVSVSFTDLQEMQNNMRESIDQGMGELQTKQGQGGLPAEPSAAAGPPVKTAMASAAPPPDQNVASEINDQTKAADQAEQETLAQVNQPGATPVSADAAPQPLAAPPPPPAQIEMGQSIDQVTAALGTPKNIVDLGTKKIYVYNDMKITFKNGKVADVQ